MQGLNLHMLGNKFYICTYLYIICTCNGVSGMNTNHLVCKDHNTQFAYICFHPLERKCSHVYGEVFERLCFVVASCCWVGCFLTHRDPDVQSLCSPYSTATFERPRRASKVELFVLEHLLVGGGMVNKYFHCAQNNIRLVAVYSEIDEIWNVSGIRAYGFRLGTLNAL